jgi:TPR repeat protein
MPASYGATPDRDIHGEATAQQSIVDKATQAFFNGDVVTAMTLLRPLAEKGFIPAQVQLAYYLDYAEEDEEAFAWYQAAAEQGDPEAQYHLGRLHGAGEGTELDPGLARLWFERAARQNHPDAIRIMAVSFEQGGPMTAVSYEQAVAWLERGAAIADPWSLARLSDAYQRGELGLRIDRDRARALQVRANQAEKIDD